MVGVSLTLAETQQQANKPFKKLPDRPPSSCAAALLPTSRALGLSSSPFSGRGQSFLF